MLSPCYLGFYYLRMFPQVSPSIRKILTLFGLSASVCLSPEWICSHSHSPSHTCPSNLEDSDTAWFDIFTLEGMHHFRIAAVTSYCNLSGLKQFKFMILQSIGWKFGMRLTGLKSRCWKPLFLSGQSRRELIQSHVVTELTSLSSCWGPLSAPHISETAAGCQILLMLHLPCLLSVFFLYSQGFI